MSEFSLNIPNDYPDWLTRHYRIGRFYEHDMLEHIARSSRRGAFVDVGSNAGNHSVYFALHCPSTIVHSFEPNVTLHRHFIAMMEANAASSKVRLYDHALADAEGELEVTFAIRTNAPNWTGRVPARRMDDVLATGDVAVIKIDVEGGETSVLRGGLGLIARCRPLIYAEAQDEEARAETAAVLSEVGYRPTGRVFNHTPTHEYAPSE